ncbi:MAG: hypothetical protein EZS28_044363, partial [Streblomastix strix]
NQASHTNLLRGLTELAQKGSQLSQNTGDPHQRSMHYQDLAYICFNTIAPVFQSCKSAMIQYWEYTNNLTSQILLIFIIVIGVTMIGEDRKYAFQLVLEVPKQNMQAVIRRLIQDDEQDYYKDAPSIIEMDIIDESDLTRAVSQVGLNKMVEGGNGYEQIFHDEKDEEENFDDD